MFNNIHYFIAPGNPLACGCDVAWLVLAEEQFSVRMLNAVCQDGTPLSDLDPLVFAEMC